MQETVATLPDTAREALKTPMGPVTTEPSALQRSGRPLVTVGDMVTYHSHEAGVVPDVALVDGLTTRDAIPAGVAETLSELGVDSRVPNEAGTLSAELIEAVETGLTDPEPVLIDVDGEEDLAAVPALIQVPTGGTVVYGQPNDGMVTVPVDAESTAQAAGVLEQFETTPRLFELLDL